MRSGQLLINCLFVYLCSTTNTLAQPTPNFLERLTTREGLSSNKINDIVQDEDGFLWIATPDGLNRFDGTEKRHYYHVDSLNTIINNYVNCLKKFHGNHIVIGTQGGLSFLNPRTGVFKNLYYYGKGALADYDNVITELQVDTKGNLWAVSKNCIYIFDSVLQLKRIIFSHYTESDAAIQRLNFVEEIFPLSNGNMLLYLNDGWYICSAALKEPVKLEKSLLSSPLHFISETTSPGFNKKDDHYFPAANIFKLPGPYFIRIQPRKDSLELFDETGVKQSSCFFPYNKYPFISWSQKMAIIDSTRLLFLFHNYGLMEIKLTWQNHIPSITGLSPVLFEKEEFVTAMKDQQENLWLATNEEGLRKISPYKQFFKSNSLRSDVPVEAIQHEVVSISRYKNNLWISTYGDGIFKKDLATGMEEHYRLRTNSNEPWPNFIWNVRQVNDDTLWLGTQAGMFWYYLPKRKYGRLVTYKSRPPVIDSVAITIQFRDSYGLIWMGLGKGKGVCYFDEKKSCFVYFPGNKTDGYPLRYPTHIAEDSKGDLWFTNDASRSLVRWDRKTRQFRIIMLPGNLLIKASDLSGLWCERDTVLWLGTVSSGLIKFNIAHGDAKIFGRECGLDNSHISSIYQDRSKKLWLATNSTLTVFDPVAERFTNYTAKDGLPVEFPTAAFYYDPVDRILYNGGYGYYFSFDPDRMEFPQVPRKTMITAMEVNGKPYSLNNSSLNFSPVQNDITIHYAAVDLTNGPETQYAYKLLGEDTSWLMAGNQRQINFSHLAPGNYTFMVRASNNRGTWSRQVASIRFDISRPFSSTAGFYALLIVFMGALFFAMYQFRLSQLRRTEQIRVEISKNLHDEVGSVLTNISLSSLLAQKQLHKEGTVSRILERIYQDSQSVSQSMRDIVWSIDPDIGTLGEALPRMLHYASEMLEAKDIELHASVAPGIEQLKLSMPQRRDLYLIFKETVNNLAKHSQASAVGIELNLDNRILTMAITDNGIGFDPNALHDSNGLKNLRQRAQNHHWQLTIHSRRGEGTKIFLKAHIA